MAGWPGASNRLGPPGHRQTESSQIRRQDVEGMLCILSLVEPGDEIVSERGERQRTEGVPARRGRRSDWFDILLLAL